MSVQADMTDREWQLHAALSALLAEINTRCVKSNPAVRLVAIDEELILTVETVMRAGESGRCASIIVQ